MNVVLALVDITFIIHTEIDKENTILGGTCKWNYNYFKELMFRGIINYMYIHVCMWNSTFNFITYLQAIETIHAAVYMFLAVSIIVIKWVSNETKATLQYIRTLYQAPQNSRVEWCLSKEDFFLLHFLYHIKKVKWCYTTF